MKLLMYEDYIKSPHLADGIDPQKEEEIRNDIVTFIVQFGNFFQSHEIIAKATIVFHAYSQQVSFKKFDRFIYSSAAVFLATKIEDCPQSVETTVKQYLFLLEYKKQQLLQQKKLLKQKQQQQQQSETAMQIEEEEQKTSNQIPNQNYNNEMKQFLQQFNEFQDKLEQKKINDCKQKIVDAESQLLKQIGFDIDIELPYKYIDFMIYKYQDLLGEDKVYWQKISKNFINDSLRTIISLYYQPYMIALGSLHLTSIYLSKNLPDLENKKWYQIMNENTVEKDVLEISEAIRKIYKDRLDSSNNKNGNGNNNAQINSNKSNEQNGDFKFYFENINIPQYDY